MVHGVFVVAGRYAHVGHLQVVEQAVELLVLAGQPDPVVVEKGQVFGQALRRVAFGIDGDEHGLDIVAAIQPVLGRFHDAERRRADIRTMRKAREHQRPSAEKSSARKQSPVMGDNLEFVYLPGRLQQTRILRGGQILRQGARVVTAHGQQ